VIESRDQTAISEDKPSSETCNQDSPLINNEINGNSEMTKAEEEVTTKVEEEVTIKKPSDSDYEASLAVNKSDKRLIDHESGFKFIKWTSNHRGYKINPSKRTTWFAESRSDDENG